MYSRFQSSKNIVEYRFCITLPNIFFTFDAMWSLNNTAQSFDNQWPNSSYKSRIVAASSEICCGSIYMSLKLLFQLFDRCNNIVSHCISVRFVSHFRGEIVFIAPSYCAELGIEFAKSVLQLSVWRTPLRQTVG